MPNLKQTVREELKELWSNRNDNGGLDTSFEEMDSLLDSIIDRAKKEVVEYVKRDIGFEEGMSPVNDYVIPYKVLEAALKDTV